MQEDAQWMSKAVFVNKHGISQVQVWEEVQRQMDGDMAPEEYWGHHEMEMDDGA